MSRVLIDSCDGCPFRGESEKYEGYGYCNYYHDTITNRDGKKPDFCSVTIIEVYEEKK